MQKTNYILLFHDNNVIYRNNIFAINTHIYIIFTLCIQILFKKIIFYFYFYIKKMYFYF